MERLAIASNVAFRLSRGRKREGGYRIKNLVWSDANVRQTVLLLL
jgi:hypothetical protein